MNMDQTENNLNRGNLQLVAFRLAGGLFGIGIEHIQEVIRFEKLSPAPGSKDYIEGLIDLREEVIPVLDLKKRMGMPSTEDYRGTRILISTAHDYLFGLIVDSVEEVYTAEITDFFPPPENSFDQGKEFALGVTRKNEEILIYLDIEKILFFKGSIQFHPVESLEGSLDKEGEIVDLTRMRQQIQTPPSTPPAKQTPSKEPRSEAPTANAPPTETPIVTPTRETPPEELDQELWQEEGIEELQDQEEPSTSMAEDD